MTIPIIPSPWGFLAQLGQAGGEAFRQHVADQDRKKSDVMRVLGLVQSGVIGSREGMAMLGENPFAPPNIPRTPREQQDFYAKAQPTLTDTPINIPGVPGLSVPLPDPQEWQQIDAMKSIYAPTTTAAATNERRVKGGVAARQAQTLARGGAAADLAAGVVPEDIAAGRVAQERGAQAVEGQMQTIVGNLLQNPVIATQAGKQRLGILQSETNLAEARIRAWEASNTINAEKIKWMTTINNTAAQEFARNQKAYEDALAQATIDANNNMPGNGTVPKDGMDAKGNVINQRQHDKYVAWVAQRDRAVQEYMKDKKRPTYDDALNNVLTAQNIPLEQFQSVADELLRVGSGGGTSTRKGTSGTGRGTPPPTASPEVMQAVNTDLRQRLQSGEITPDEYKYIIGVSDVKPDTPKAKDGTLDDTRADFMKIIGRTPSP